MVENLKQTLGNDYNFESIYRALGISRQKFFSGQQRATIKSKSNDAIIALVNKWRENHNQMGSRAMYDSFKQAGIDIGIGITKFERLLSEYNLTVGKVRCFIPKTTDSKGVNKKYPNLTNGLIINDINQLIVSDITYFFISNKPYFLFLFKDVYSQRILSIVPSSNMQAENCMIAINEIVELRGEQSLINTILHTDNGGQYGAKKFVSIVTRLKMQISRAENCKQNGSAEQLNHIAKNMYLKHWSILSFEELVASCKKFKYLNNHERAIKQLGGLTPVNFEEQIKNLSLDKRLKKQMYDFSN